MRFVIIFIFMISVSILSYAQRFENTDFSAFNIKINFSDDFIQKISPLRSYAMGYFFEGKGNDRMKALLVHNTYATFKYMVEEGLDIAILPPDILGKKAKYDDYGYPDITIQKAIDKGATRYFYKLAVKYESMPLKHYYYVDSLLSPGQDVDDIEMKYLIPRITIDWNIYNKYGYIPIKSYSSNAVSKEPIPVEKCLLHGYLPSRYSGIEKCDSETLMEILEAALNDLMIVFLED